MKIFESVKYRFLTFTYAEVDNFDSSDQNYLMLKDNYGNELYLTGCNTRYRGEGPRGTLKLLNKLGFNLDECFVFYSKLLQYIVLIL